MKRLALAIIAAFSAAATLTAQENILKFSRPAAYWEEAVPVGNGRIGAMVYGDPFREEIQLNEETVWQGSPYNNHNPEALGALSLMRSLIFEGRYAEAQQLGTDKFLSKVGNEMSYQTVGSLFIEYTDRRADRRDLNSYSRRLDIGNAVASAEYTAGGVRFTEEVFASFTDQLIIIRISADKAGAVNVFPDQLCFIFCQIPRFHHAAVFRTAGSFGGKDEFFRHMKGFAARRGAHIQHLRPGPGSRKFSHKHGTYILHGKKALPERLKPFQVIISGYAQGIRQVRMNLRFHALFFQTAPQFFHGNPVPAASDCQRMLFLQEPEHDFCLCFSIFLLPQIQNPFRTGIPDGHFLFSVRRICYARKFSCCRSEYAVYVSFQTGKSFFHGQLHRFTADRPVRHTVHIFQLVYGTSQDAPDHRLHFPDFYFGKLIQNIVDLDQMLQRSLCHTGDKCPLPFFKVLIFRQYVPEDLVAVTPLLRHFHQNRQHNFPFIY